MAFFSPFSSLSWSRELWCQPSGVNSISLAFSSTRRLNRDSAGISSQDEGAGLLSNKLKNHYVVTQSESIRKCRAPTLDEGITYDNVLSSILRHKKFSWKRRERKRKRERETTLFNNFGSQTATPSVKTPIAHSYDQYGRSKLNQLYCYCFEWYCLP